ncbi:hypothetical protein B0H63DRAFT_560112 [Podospora didyma]|uniref:Uncharacterized protein n=1 Tax=Podospora didyma TaxID=330526 RepID=A0AAE0NQ66_9PEZI|nr:hypothetical protein B0H63DRAFT_560112 [Podospora didyma]
MMQKCVRCEFGYGADLARPRLPKEVYDGLAAPLEGAMSSLDLSTTVFVPSLDQAPCGNAFRRYYSSPPGALPGYWGASTTRATTEAGDPADLELNANARNPAGEILGIATDIIQELVDLAGEEDKECKFTNRVGTVILLDYRDLNALVFSDRKASTANLQGAYCFEVDLPLAFFRHKKYKICAFEKGKFVRPGDGGCRSWGFGGCYTRSNDRTVSFCNRIPNPTSTVTRAVTSVVAVTSVEDITTSVHAVTSVVAVTSQVIVTST